MTQIQFFFNILIFVLFSHPQMLSLQKIRTYLETENINLDWERLNGIVLALEPVVVFTIRAQRELYVAGDLFCCQFNLERNGRKNPEHADTIAEMLEKLNKRITTVTSPQFAAGLYMDPRFVHSELEDDEELPHGQMDKAVEWIVQTHHRILQEVYKPPTKKSSISQPTKMIRTDSDTIPIDAEEQESPTAEQVFEFTLSRKRSKHVLAPFRTRMEKLKQREKEIASCHILDYWKSVQARDPEMAAVAKSIYSLPLTQVTVERAFSELPLLITDRGSNFPSEIIML